MDTSPSIPTSAKDVSTDGPTITVGYDGSDAAVAAVRWAASEAAHQGGILRVLTCVTDPAEPITDRLLPDPRPVYEMAEWLMQSQAATGSGAGAAEFSLSVVQGPAEHRLVNESSGSDLLVIGSGGHLLLGAWRLGAITHEILRHAHCPVVLVPSGHIAGGHARVVVGVEDHTSHAALTWAAIEASRRRAELVIVHARRPDEGGHEATEHASSVLAEASRVAVKHCDAPITTRMVDGPPAPSLLAQTFNADMLVVGARAAGHGTDKPGSVARAVGACATCPTVIVQPNAVDTDSAGPSAR